MQAMTAGTPPHDVELDHLARVAAVHADGPALIFPNGETLRAHAPNLALVVGDWVQYRTVPGDLERVLVTAVHPRRTSLSRKAAGKGSGRQSLVANVDKVMIVSSLDGDLNPSRIERYLTMVWDGGARPVVLLTKLDTCPDPEPLIAAVEEAAMGVPVHALSVHSGTGTEVLSSLIEAGETVVFVGSSGVGKSTLVNHLTRNTAMATGAVRAHDQRGKHTTTHRQLIPLADGAVLIDTPGLRELLPGADEAALAATFGDIDALAEGCRFRDCRHQDEPGCAVREAVDHGRLKKRRYSNYQKLQKEQDSLAVREQEWQKRKKDKVLHKAIRQSQRIKGR